MSRRRNILYFVLELMLVCLVLPAYGHGAAQRSNAPALGAGPAFIETASLIVFVRDENGSAFSGTAMVTLQDRSHQILSTIPTSAGMATFDELVPGEYTTLVNAPGYLTANEHLNIVVRNQQQQVYVTLKRDEDSPLAPTVGSPAISPKLQKVLTKAVKALYANNLDAAFKQLDAAYRLAPSNPQVHYMQGLLADRRGNAAAAQASWEKAILLDPKHNLALLGLASLLVHRSDFAGAMGYLERALQNDPNSWRAHQLLSVVCVRQGNYPEAITHAERSLELGKGPANIARLTLAEALLAQNQGERAEATLQAFLKAGPPPAQAEMANRMVQKLKSAPLPVERSAAGDSAPSVEPANLVNLPLLKPDLPSWLPANVDDSVPAVEDGVSCPTQEILDGAANRIQEFMSNIDRITATEILDHQVLNEWGLPIRQEKRSFDYVVSISKIREGYLNVQEYRNGTQDLSVFPDAVATRGLPAAVLVFHPYYREDYDMKCEGLGRWKGGHAWQIHFAQKQGKSSRIRGYRAGLNAPSIPVALIGRAWIAKNTFQVVRIETDLQAPMPEIRYLAEHMDIEYGPVNFKKQNETIWLPVTADIYFNLRGRRIRRKNAFQSYLLFSVDEKQTISAPKEAPASE